MMSLTRVRRITLCFPAAVLLAAPVSCNITLTPPPEAVLAGSWKVAVSNNTDLDETLVFDATGKLIERRIRAGATTVSQTDVHRSTKVDGNTVRIQTVGDQLFGGDNVFEGTFNADKTIIIGTLSTVISAGSTTITTSVGNATLTKL